MKKTMKQEKGKMLILLVALVLAAVMVLPSAGFSWGPGDGSCSHDRFAQRAEAIKGALDLNENQNDLWEAMKLSMQNLRDLTLQEGDQLDVGTRRRFMARNHLLMGAELAAENPDFESVGKKLKAEYPGEFHEVFNETVDARVAFFTSLTLEQRDAMLKMEGRGRHHGQKPYRGMSGQ